MGGTHSNEYHFIVNMLYYYYYYYCHNIVLVNKLAYLHGMIMHYETCLFPTICDMEVLCTVLNDIFSYLMTRNRMALHENTIPPYMISKIPLPNGHCHIWNGDIYAGL